MPALEVAAVSVVSGTAVARCADVPVRICQTTVAIRAVPGYIVLDMAVRLSDLRLAVATNVILFGA
jgi:hypothetical protein